MTVVTAKLANKLIKYNHETGEFFSRKTGRQIANTGRKYPSISINGKPYHAHRVAWLLMTGEWPEGDIDHINNDSRDNRWRNLRDGSTNENIWNCSIRSDNTSGVKGVSWQATNKNWIVHLSNYKDVRHRGAFANKSDAIICYNTIAAYTRGRYARLNPVEIYCHD